MYVTAQRVRSRSREGINTFFNLHSPTDMASVDWDSPSIEQVAEAFPGVLLEKDCDLPPGGNRVRSFLDVATANETAVPRIRAALDEFERRLRQGRLPWVETIDHISVRFDAERALHEEQIDEYRTLRARVLRLIEGWHSRQATPPAA